MVNFLEVERIELNFRQRWSSYLTIILAVAALGIAYLLRTRAIEATQPYENRDVGISTRYPVGWLLEEPEQPVDFVVRIQDPAAIPFKTTLQIAIIPISADTRLADLPSQLHISRATVLPIYKPLTTTPITLPNGQNGLQITYSYAAVESNPRLQSEPVMVRAIDVITLRSNQALIITYRADTQSFDRYYHFFESFLRSLDY
jgi:hypothetical protein